MPILQRCWTPYPVRPWTNVKYGSYYTAVYSAVFHAVALAYCLLCLSYVDARHFHSFYQHLSYKGSITLSATAAAFCILVLMATVLLTSGIRQGRRHFFLPWLSLMSIEVLAVAALGVSFIAFSYSRMYPIVAALILWCLDAFHLYCLLCVVSQYQVLKDLEMPQFVILSSQT